jgi:secreted trypsin-like serine protease
VVRPRALAAALASAVTTATAVLALASPASAVADGVPAQPGQYRFNVKLVFTDIPRPDGSHYNSGCTGALIAPRWIVTAGHCFHDVARNPVSGPVPYSSVAVVGGVDDADPARQVVTVLADYQSPANDIAIAELAEPVRGIRPLALPRHAPTVGEVLRITGWGAQDSVDPAPATHLRTGQVTVAEVQAAYLGVVGYRPLPTTSACLYDSGAPYFAEPRHGQPYLVSVESDGPDCPHDQVETTARVDVVTDWIRTIIGIHTTIGAHH